MKSTMDCGNVELVDVSLDYIGLAQDTHGDVWLFTNLDSGVVVFANEECDLGFSVNRERAVNDYGPFTKFNGKITLEND